ncbi:MAG: hypothetical protein EON86_06040 [Brevundimonas sp.]|nr:MAG: hypothetical protein EON86_06040 [Brevundimonas sp.]
MQRYLTGLAAAFVAALLPVFIGQAGFGWLIGALAPIWPLRDSYFAQACVGDPATGLATHHLVLTALWLGGLAVLGNAFRVSRNRIDRALDPMAWRMRYIVPMLYVVFGLYCFGPLITTFGDAFECGRGRGLIPTVLLTLGVFTVFIGARFVIFATSDKRD